MNMAFTIRFPRGDGGTEEDSYALFRNDVEVTPSVGPDLIAVDGVDYVYLSFSEPKPVPSDLRNLTLNTTRVVAR